MKNRPTKKLQAVACLLALLAANGVHALEINDSNSTIGQSRTVVIFGDSITAGSMLPTAERTNVWPQVVEHESHGQFKMINEGKGGRPTASVTEFAAMLQHHPQCDLLVIALGMNDSRDLTGECVPKAVANIRQMIEKGRQAYGEKLRVLLVGPTNISKERLGPTKNIGNEREAKLRELGEAFAKLAKELDCDFIALFGVVPETSLRTDGVHPDVAGNFAIARVMLAKLKP